MKNFAQSIRLVYLCTLALVAVSFFSCQEKRYRIAVSQSFSDDWHNQLKIDLELEASTHPEVEIVFKHANWSNEQQVHDIERFLQEGMDLLIVSPNDTEMLAPVIEKVYDSGIPVILIDSRLNSGKYSASIGVDNVDIGDRVGSFAVYLLKGKGEIIEVRGLENTSTSIDRHKGLVDVLRDFDDISIVDSCFCDWSYQMAYRNFEVLLERHPEVDLVAAGNDEMARAVYDVCVNKQLSHIPFIIGVDGLTSAGKGVSNVIDGKLTATCVNPTGGYEAINLALNILEGRPYDRNTLLNTILIYENNANVVMLEERKRNMLNKRIAEMNGSLTQSWKQISMQRWLLLFAAIVTLLLVGFIFSVRRYHRIQAELRQKVEDSTKSKLNFFSNVSHSFRTPLTLIIDPLNQLIREGGLSARQNELLQIMSRNTDQLLNLTNQVLNVLKMDAFGKDEKLDEIAKDAVSNYEKIVRFRSSFSSEQIQSDLLNTVENALLPDNEEEERIAEESERASILVIDDNADVRQYIALAFDKDFVVLQASNGSEGLQIAQQNVPDLIICDVMMPVMDGLECCRKLKEGETTSHIPVIMLTAYALDDQRILGYQSGADAYITKPFNVDVLRARIQNLLDSRKRIDATQENRNDELAQNSIGVVDRDLVEHFHDFIVKNISNTDLGIPDLCNEFNMSRVQVYRKFKSLTGQSPVEVIRVIRLKRAKQLLETTELSVSEVAYEVGFSSASYFAKCYRDYFNETPTDVQRRVRENNK